MCTLFILLRAAHVAQWALAVLGDLSAKYSSTLTKKQALSSSKALQVIKRL